MLAANSSNGSALSFLQALAFLGIVAAAILVAGLVVLWSRRSFKDADNADQGVVRSWLALALVIGLVLFCGVAIFVNNANLENVLVGGLTASAGTAVAYYFSSKAADQARQDILNAAVGTETVPDLHRLTKDDAQKRLGQTSFQLVVSPASSQSANATVSTQVPEKDSQARRASSVVVTLED